MKTCEWQAKKQRGVWMTECKEAAMFDLHPTKEMGFRFCPYCGGNICTVSHGQP